MKRGTFFLSTILFTTVVVLFSATLSASQVEVVNYSIGTEYSVGSNLTGIISLNLNNVPYNSELIANRGTNTEQIISLAKFLSNQAEFSNTVNYSCNPSSCNGSYSAIPSSQSSSKTFSLTANQPKVFGLTIIGNQISPNTISGFSLNVTSDAQTSSKPQLTITPLNESSIAWSANKPSGTFGSQTFVGCYNSSSVSGTVLIGSGKYCEEITLQPAPILEIGTALSGSGTSSLKMYLEDLNKNVLGQCTISAGTYSSTNKDCLVKSNDGTTNESIASEGNYLVCINIPSPTSGDSYSMNYEQTAPVCGTSPSSTNYVADYPIFAILGTFAPVGSVTINDSNTPSIEPSIDSYIKDNYNYTCPAPNGCAIPIVFQASQNQNITLSNPKITATTEVGTQQFNSLYNLTLSSATISASGSQNFSLNAAGFSVGTSFGNQTFSLDFYNGTAYTSLFSNTVNVLKIPTAASVSPTITAAGISVPFTVKVNKFGADTNITKYYWNFGDGQNAVTTTNTTMHSYDQVGTFLMSITLTDAAGLNSTTNFTITATTPKNAAEGLLTQKMNDLRDLNNQLSNYSTFIQSSLSSLLNLDNISSQLSDINSTIQSISSNDKYILLIQQLSTINVPTIKESVSASSPFIPSKSDINLDALKGIGGIYDSSKQSEYLNAIDAWELENVSITISYKEFSTVYENSEETLMSAVELKVTPLSSGYLLVPAFDNINFNGEFQKSQNYYYTTLSANNPETISFSTTQSLDPTQLPIFVSPSLNSINLPSEKSGSTWIILGIILAGILIVGIVAYVILGKWYQKRYESYLFKNKNDLYNIVNYIHSAKTRKVKNNDIERNLRKSSWTSEQISYVMKKYAGKGVGLPGFIKRMREVKSHNK